MLTDFIDLYKAAPKIDQLKRLDNQEYRAFKTKSGLPVALVSTEKHLAHIPHYEAYYPFFNETGIFWMVPSDSPNGEIAGFIMRGLNSKTYRSYFNQDIPQYVFGFHAWNDFKPNTTIVVTEGVKKCLYLQQFYPFVLTTLTANISDNFLPFLSTLTNKLLIALDSDHSGRRAAKQLETKLSKIHNFRYHSIFPRLIGWDDYFDSPDLEYSARIYLNDALHKLK